MSTSSVPTPRRLAKARWLDARVIGGIVLVVAAVVIGAKVVGASSKTVPVWVTTRPLATGTVISAGDVAAAEVNLGQAASFYLDAQVNPAGREVTSDIGQGLLLPADFLRERRSGRLMVIGIERERMPPGVSHGARVDLYLTVEGSSGEAGQGPETSLLAADLTVQSVSAPASGGLSGAGSDKYQIAVALDPAAAAEMVRRLPTGDVTAVLITQEER